MDEDGTEGESSHPKQITGEILEKTGSSILGGAILGASISGPLGMVIGGLVGVLVANRIKKTINGDGGGKDG